MADDRLRGPGQGGAEVGAVQARRHLVPAVVPDELDLDIELAPPPRLERPVAELHKWELEVLPGIGDHLAVAITNYVRTGEWKTYEELTSADLAV